MHLHNRAFGISQMSDPDQYQKVFIILPRLSSQDIVMWLSFSAIEALNDDMKLIAG